MNRLAYNANHEMARYLGNTLSLTKQRHTALRLASSRAAPLPPPPRALDAALC